MKKPPEQIVIEMVSDAAFGRVEDTPSVVHVEVEHDAYGLPIVAGKALRGLLRDSWFTMQAHFPEFPAAGRRVLGPHADLEETAILRFGHATMEEASRAFFIAVVARRFHPLLPEAILAVLTDIRSQTSERRKTGAPAKGTLRFLRVICRGLATAQDLQCLALACPARRHAGLGPNRGRAHIRVSLDGDVEGTRRLAHGRRQ
jgi:hypothetical protein